MDNFDSFLKKVIKAILNDIRISKEGGQKTKNAVLNKSKEFEEK